MSPRLNRHRLATTATVLAVVIVGIVVITTAGPGAHSAQKPYEPVVGQGG
jgi:hypothetical protein